MSAYTPPRRFNAANGLLEGLGVILVLVALWMCYQAQFATVDVPMCGDKPLRPGSVCFSLTREGPAVGYQELLDAQRAAAPGRALRASVIVGGWGGLALLFGASLAVRRNRCSPREAVPLVLLRATGPLLVVAVAVLVLTLRAGLAGYAVFGIPWLTTAPVLTALLAVGGGAIVVYARHEEIFAAKVREAAQRRVAGRDRPTTPPPPNPAATTRHSVSSPAAADPAATTRGPAPATLAPTPETLDSVPVTPGSAPAASGPAPAPAGLAAAPSAPASTASAPAPSSPKPLPEQDFLDPTSDLWPDRRALLRPTPAPPWQIAAQRTAAILGLTGLLTLVLSATVLPFRPLGDWTHPALAVLSLTLLALRAQSRPPTRWTLPHWATATALTVLAATALTVPARPLTWSALLTAVLLIAATYRLANNLGFACRQPRHAHAALHLGESAVLVLAGFLATCAAQSGTAPAIVGYLVAFALVAMMFPSSARLPVRPPGWLHLRLALLGVALATAGYLFASGDLTCRIAAGCLALLVLVGGVGAVRGLRAE
ncbi:hypothetical protein [Crossiella sp. SN42]|uniref:hypothetical protein n=1 Tax=Crossiella sp. SN42 TaxID=2944808 RepID=UPI00273A627D|nr:hypothetical protein [Crossiella sp. SN42]